MKITNAWICRTENDRIQPIFGDIQTRKGKIIDIEQKNFSDFLVNNDTINSTKNTVDAAGRVVTLPMINFHDHIYSRLAKGLSISGEMNNFENILKNLWWKLDKYLDKEMVKASAEMAVLESIQNGVTYIFDHHSSPKFTKGSLSVISETIQEFGLRGVLCFETSNRNGETSAKAALSENEKFLLNNTSEDIKAMLGLHASFTLTDDSLESAGKIISENDVGIHIHLCEGGTDRRESQRLYSNLPTRRLKKNGLLNQKSIVAHGVDLIDEDYLMLKEAGSALVFCPDSNLNNSVGIADFQNVPEAIQILAGTDGMHANIAKSLKQLFLLHRHQGNSFEKSFEWIIRIYFDQLDFVRNYFPDFPSLQIEDRADFIVWDYFVPTPITAENFWGHFIYGILERPIHSVIQNGKFLMKNNKLLVNLNGQNDKNIYAQGKRIYSKF